MAATGKFHINKAGNVAPCHATVRACRYGSSDHFEDKSAAQAEAARRMAEEHGDKALAPLKKKAVPARGLPRAAKKAPAQGERPAAYSHLAGPTPQSHSMTSPGYSQSVPTCSHCGGEDDSADGYSTCCNEPMSYSTRTRPATYRYNFKSYSEAQEFYRANGRPSGIMGKEEDGSAYVTTEELQPQG